MMKKSILLLLITCQIAQPVFVSAQSNERTWTFEENHENRKCLSNLNSAGTNPSDYQNLKDMTNELLDTDLAGSDEIKDVYRKNGCNPDAVDRVKTSTSVKNRFDTVDQDFPHQINDPQPSDFKQACEMSETLLESEGCLPIRELNKAIKDRKFTAKDYHAVKKSKNAQYSNIGVAVAGGSMLIGAVGVYIAYQQMKISERMANLEEQKYADSKTTTEQTTQPCKTDAPQKSAEPKTEPSEPKQEQTRDRHSDPQTTAIQQTSVDQKNTIPDVKDPEHPVVDRDPENDSDWKSFNNEVQEQNKKCDIKKEAKKREASAFEIKNQQIIHSDPNGERGKGCSISDLKLNLLFLKSKNSICNDPECIEKKKTRKELKRREQKKKYEAFKKCTSSNGGTNPAEREECKAIQKELMNNLGTSGNSLLSNWENTLNETNENPFKFKSLPTPAPLPSLRGGL